MKALFDRGQKLSVGKYHENATLEANILDMIEEDGETYKRQVAAFVSFA